MWNPHTCWHGLMACMFCFRCAAPSSALPESDCSSPGTSIGSFVADAMLYQPYYCESDRQLDFSACANAPGCSQAQKVPLVRAHWQDQMPSRGMSSQHGSTFMFGIVVHALCEGFAECLQAAIAISVATLTTT
jgi:hypothetical protein